MTTKGQARNMFPALRVFVFGQEITEDVLSVTVTLNDARAPSTAEIVLANKDAARGIDDRYIVTEKDILAMVAEVPADVRLPDVDQALLDSESLLQELNAKLAKIQHLRNVADDLELINLDLPVDQLEAETLAAETRAQQKALMTARRDDIRTATETTLKNVTRQIRENLKRVVGDPLKALVLGTKVGETFAVGNPRPAAGGPELTATITGLAGLRGEASTYPMQVGDCIFHSNDPVRIFFRDPRDARVWFYMFAGYVSDWVDDVTEHNEKTVTLRCEDVLRRLRYARITTSPGLVDIDQVSTSIDLVLQNFFNDNFSDLTFVEFLTTMVFGFTGAGTLDKARDTGNVLSPDALSGTTTIKLINAKGQSTKADMPKDGCGFFSPARSIVFSLGSAVTGSTDLSDYGSTPLLVAPVDNLAVYQAVVDHQVRTTDLSSMALKANDVTPIQASTLRTDPGTGEVLIDDVIKSIGENPQIYPVDGGRLIILAPATLGEGYNAGVLLRDFKGPELQTTWSTRLSKIYDVLERIQFSFYASPRGDILAEMPLFDFDPEQFGASAVTYRQIAEVLGDATARTMFDDSHTSGPFAADYHVAKRDTIRWSRAFSDEKVRTLVTTTWYNLPLLDAGSYSPSAGIAPARRLAESLVPQFGVRAEAAEPNILPSDRKSAEIYCQLLLNRFNGDARTANVSCIPQLRMMPNRPIKFTERSFIGTLREVTHSITWGERGDMDMSLKLNFIRGWDGNVDAATKQPFYSYLGGFRANPQNYALLLRSQQPITSAAAQKAPKPDEGES